MLYSIYMEYLLKVNLILSLLFLRCVDHKIIIMPLLPTVILFIDTDITARNNVDKYCNTEVIFSLEDLLFFIQHCSLFTLHNSCIQIEIPGKKEFFFSEHHKEPTIFCCNFLRWFNSYCNFSDVIIELSINLLRQILNFESFLKYLKILPVLKIILMF